MQKAAAIEFGVRRPDLSTFGLAPWGGMTVGKSK
ncbi:protein of unknown function [Pararobbsia alpina]